MSIEIKKNPRLDLDIPEFVCDRSLGAHLERHPLLQNLNSFGFTAFVGKPGSGKTSLMVSLLTGRGNKKVFRKTFNHVLVCMPSTSRASMKKNIFAKHAPEKMFEELDLPMMETLYARLQASSAEGEKSLLILDDVGASLKDKAIQKLFRRVVYNRRHLKVHICVLLQSYLSCPKEVRKLCTNVICFKPSKVEFENLLAETLEIKRDLALEVMNMAFDRPHQWLLINVETQRMFKGFDELIVHDDTDTDADVEK